MSFECSVGEWHRKKDATTGAYYYANSTTLTSCWTVPEGWVEPPAPEGAPPPLTVDESWRETTDPVSGRIYYVNTMTMESSWTKPIIKTGKEILQVLPSKLDMPVEDPDTSEDDEGGERARKHTGATREMKSDSHSSSSSLSLHTYETKMPTISSALEIERSPRLKQAALLARMSWTNGSSNRGKKNNNADNSISKTNTNAFVTHDDNHNNHSYSDDEDEEIRRERIGAIRALLADESAYFLDLQVFGAEFEIILQLQKAQGKEGVTIGEMKQIVRNIPELFSHHLSFAHNIQEYTKSEALLESEHVCKLLLTLIYNLENYAFYLSYQKHLKSVLALLDRLEGDRPGLKTTLDYIRGGKCKNGIVRPLQYYLELPYFRPSAYGNLILNVLKTMDPSGEGFRWWNNLLEASESMVTRIEQNAQFIIARDLVADIQKRLHFVNASEIGLKLVTPTRVLVQSGQIKKKLAKSRLGSSYKSYMFYVFNDMAMYTSVPDKLKRIVPKRCMPMLGMKVEASAKDVNFTVDSLVKNVQFKAATKEERDKWVRVLQDGIKRATDAAAQRPTTKHFAMVSPGRGW